MLLSDKKCLIFGVANNKSIAYGIASALKQQGASIALNYLSDVFKKRVEPLGEELGVDFIFQCDVTKDEELAKAVELAKKEWGSVDVIIHSLAFANKEELTGRYVDTSTAGFLMALEISAYSLAKTIQYFEPLLNDNASIVTLSYYGAEKYIPNYNVMGVAKSALESSVRYLAMDLGERQIRVNALSAGPIKTLAASGISNFAKIIKAVEERAPLKRSVTLEEISNAGLFLASPLSSGITGEVLHVDCGFNSVGI